VAVLFRAFCCLATRSDGASLVQPARWSVASCFPVIRGSACGAQVQSAGVLSRCYSRRWRSVVSLVPGRIRLPAARGAKRLYSAACFQLLWAPGASLGVDGGPSVSTSAENASRPVVVARRLMGAGHQRCSFITFAGALIVVAAKVVFRLSPVGVGQRVRRRCRLGILAKHFDGQQQSFALVAAAFPDAAITTIRRLGR